MTHIPVLKDELIQSLNIKEGDIIVDGTLGGGGHTSEIIKIFKDKVKIIGLDLDFDAKARTLKSIGNLKNNFTFVNRGFQEISEILREMDINEVNSVMLDLGISSFQLEVSERGFSFKKDEPLLMTMKKDPNENDITAYDIVNTWGEKTLADIIYGFGEEQFSRRIAKAIVLRRKEKEIKTTFDLVEIIENAVPLFYKKGKIHPATKTFQALRIAVNSELTNLEQVIEKGFKSLKNKGRMSIITFHSLEDRIVKRAFINLKDKGVANIINKKPISPSEIELKENPRSRSAKLRIIEKI
ncbi:TPA: 16S rRNA (cytosine(1402)-N(4))-methyltransferase RsmH [Candidatus Nomurabacteria bacterium]|nr:MAG: Ribosomal RNA small subunit methyltransferase H [Parcubacteria bacterium RAAC4_OD1_1]HCY26654.1 16S rRNA (cytosine(1402)-N(4))-methyltransferase RsmH [Candidatus Nomurabacteria bacterium]